MKDEIYVFGHKNPDTDSICSAIAYAYLLKKIGYKNVIPTRLGELNSETKYILKYFNIEPPILLENVEPTVEDLQLIIKIPKITPDDPIIKALQIMMDLDIGMIPIVDQNGKYISELTLSDILKDYMENLTKSFEKHETYYRDIIDVLNGQIVSGKCKENKLQIKGRIIFDSGLRLNEQCNKGDIVITGTNEFLQLNAFKSKAGFIIMTQNCKLTPEMKNLAEKNQSIVVKVSQDCFETIKLLNLIIPIKNLMSIKSFYIFHSTDNLKNVHESIENLDLKFQHFPVVDHNNKLFGLITRDLNFYPKKVILVDHNEISQSVKGIKKAKIIQIIDHHKLSDIQSNEPIFVYCKPIGCTATLIWERYKQENISINKNIAGIMLSAILSDTLLFTSPTCTEIDKKAAYYLADIAGIDIDDFGPKMIEASTDTKTMSIDQIFTQDLKIFTFKDRKFCISQITTTNYKDILDRFDFSTYLDKICKTKGYEFAIVMVTDVVLNGSEIIFEGERKNVVRNTFNISKNKTSEFLKGIVSRKKQVLPPLLANLSRYD
ncbi:MAG: putative manganese-dependent inorganic diphosphatase [Candidatus Helarchaeota archaeon]